MPAVTADSVFPRLEPLLPSVQKPIQYVGGELNSTPKEWGEDAPGDGSSPMVRWALMYPDAYEVGLPNQGVQILYEVLNERDWILAERTYSVWPDLEKLMPSTSKAPTGWCASTVNWLMPCSRMSASRSGQTA